MEQFKIHYRGKSLAHASFLQIHLLNWFLVPIVVPDYSEPVPPPSNAFVSVVAFNTWRGKEQTSIASVKRLHRGVRRLTWLFFTIVYTKVYKTEAADIYPAGYNYKNDSEPVQRDRYQKLIETGYYS